MDKGPGRAETQDVMADGWREFDAACSDWLLGLLSDQQVPRAAATAVAVGCNSPSLSALAKLRHPDPSSVLPLVFGTCSERGVDFPLKNDAIKSSVDHVLARMVTGAVSPEDASVKLWSLADLDHDFCFDDDLHDFRGLAITLDIAEDPDCEFDLDRAEWRAEMLALAHAVLARGGIAPQPSVVIPRAER
jgi:hypothetical protein